MDAAGHQRLFHLLQLTAHALKVQADRQALEGAGVTAAQAAVLYAVAEAGALSQRELATRLKVRESAVTAMVARLMRDGFLQREPSPQDRRVRLLTLAPAGEQALVRLRGALLALNSAITQALGGAAGVDRFADDLRRLLSIMPKTSDVEPEGS